MRRFYDAYLSGLTTARATPEGRKAVGRLPAYDLMEDLRKARAEHSLDRRMRVYLAPKVLIVDEFGIWPYDRESATAFFSLVSARYERGSIILTLYARVSSDRQDVDLSVSAQLRALRDYADKNGYEVVREFVDEAESGRSTTRPDFQRMIDEAKRTDTPFKEILVWKFSRFTRKREHAVVLKSMRRGLRVVSITEQADDRPTGKLMDSIIETIDEY